MTPWLALASGVVLVAFFVAVSGARTTPRLTPLPTDVPPTLPAQPTGRSPNVLSALGIIALVVVLVAGLGDATASALNLAPPLAHLGAWVLVPLIAIFAGDWWAAVSPWTTLSHLVNGRRSERPELVDRFGVGPAVVVLVALGWVATASTDARDPRTLALVALVFTAAMVAAGAFVGPATALRLLDPFTTIGAAYGAIASGDRLPTRGERRPFLRALPAWAPWSGFPLLMTTVLGVALFAGLVTSSVWTQVVGSAGRGSMARTIGLLVTVALSHLLFTVACRVAAAVGSLPTPDVVARFAHALVPLAAGLVVAAGVPAIIYEGQFALAAASDPMGRGWDLLGTADLATAVVGSGIITVIQTVALTAAGLMAIDRSHDRALSDFGSSFAVRSQYAILTLMVAITSLGLLTTT